MVVVPQVLDLFWSAIEREVEKQGRDGDVRAAARHRAAPAHTRSGGSCSGSVHAQLGGGLRLFATAGAFLPPALQQAWEDMGVIVIQGYGATETAAGCGARRWPTTRWAASGWPPKPVEMRIAEDGEIQFRGPTLFQGYWDDPEATAAAFTEDGWYKSRRHRRSSTTRAGSILHGRKKDIIVLPNGFNVYPEDIENALRVAGIRDSVAIETRPGRIEAVVLGAGTHAVRATRGRHRRSRARTPEDVRREIDAAVKAANASARPEPADRRLARCGPRRTSRAPTRSRSSATGSARGHAIDAPLPVVDEA